MKTIIILLGHISLAGCASSHESSEELVARIGHDLLAKDALLTYKDYVAFNNAKETPAENEDRIPSELWVGSIQDLSPEYVYLSGTNIVVVLKASRETEEGLYIVPPISSYVSSDQGFVRSAVPQQRGFLHTYKLPFVPQHGGLFLPNISTFTRDLKHNNTNEEISR
jgi:hypothetical protein